MADNSILNPGLSVVAGRSLKLFCSMMLASMIISLIIYIVIYVLIFLPQSTLESLAPRSMPTAILYSLVAISVYLYTASISMGVYENWRNLVPASPQ